MTQDATLLEKLIKAREEGRKEGQINLQKLVEEINECYGKQFLPEGFVRARITDYGTLWLDIGDRNGEFLPDGERVGSGYNLGEAIKWDILDLTEEPQIEPENTLIGMFQKERTDAISEMFNNVDNNGIYPTTRFFVRLDNCVRKIIRELRQ